MRLIAMLLLVLSLLSLIACSAKRDVKLTFDELPPASTGQAFPEYLKKVMFTNDPVIETENLLFYDAYTSNESKAGFVGRISDAMETWTKTNNLNTGSVEFIQVDGLGYRAHPAKLYSALLTPISKVATQKEFIAQSAFFYTWVDSTGTNSEQWRNGAKGTQNLVLALGAPTDKVPRGYKLKQGIHWNVFILQGEALKAALKNVAQVHAQAKKSVK